MKLHPEVLLHLASPGGRGEAEKEQHACPASSCGSPVLRSPQRDSADTKRAGISPLPLSQEAQSGQPHVDVARDRQDDLPLPPEKHPLA